MLAVFSIANFLETINPVCVCVWGGGSKGLFNRSFI